uniref:Uncharacterized protein n=1 Tax=Catharus ustulatus TaxID=91951 RepID=A0A8C3TIU9_CATUS
ILLCAPRLLTAKEKVHLIVRCALYDLQSCEIYRLPGSVSYSPVRLMVVKLLYCNFKILLLTHRRFFNTSTTVPELVMDEFYSNYFFPLHGRYMATDNCLPELISKYWCPERSY